MSSCRSCGAQVLWRRHVRSGRAAPIDAEPAEGGNIILLENEEYRVISKEQAEAYQGGNAHLNHFATCPKAEAHR